MKNAAHKPKMKEDFSLRLQTMSGLVRSPWMLSDCVDTQRALARGLPWSLDCRVRGIQGFISWLLQIYRWLTWCSKSILQKRSNFGIKRVL